MNELIFVVPDDCGRYGSKVAYTGTNEEHAFDVASQPQTQGKVYMYRGGICVGEVYVYKDNWACVREKDE